MMFIFHLICFTLSSKLLALNCQTMQSRTRTSHSNSHRHTTLLLRTVRVCEVMYSFCRSFYFRFAFMGCRGAIGAVEMSLWPTDFSRSINGDRGHPKKVWWAREWQQFKKLVGFFRSIFSNFSFLLVCRERRNFFFFVWLKMWKPQNPSLSTAVTKEMWKRSRNSQ